MNKGANTPNPDPQIAGLGERQLGSQEQAIAHTCFAGPRALKVLWIMEPIEVYTVETNKPKGVKNVFSNFALDAIGGGAAPGLAWIIKG